ncbi:MAG: ArsB/NhaD family transporter [Planctomycetota bacterium]
MNCQNRTLRTLLLAAALLALAVPSQAQAAAPAPAPAPTAAPAPAPSGDALAPSGHGASEAPKSPVQFPTYVVWLVGAILVGVYLIISFEIWHRTLAALTGGSLILAVTYIGGYFSPNLRILDFDGAMGAIDWNVIFLLFGMMIVVGILKETGLFQWCAYKAFQLAKGKTFRMAALFMILTAVVSANLDNVTTMLLVAPVSIEVCRVLGIRPLALLIPETLASNIGGTATLIGDPPNIMIGSHAGLTYVDFIVNLAPCICIVMVAHLLQMRWVYRKEYAKQIPLGEIPAMIERLRKEYGITNQALLNWGGIVLGFVILLFFLHGTLKMPVAVPALGGAAVLLIFRDRIEMKRRRAEREGVTPVEKSHGILHILEKEIEWPTLVFFMFLFVVVRAADRVGLIEMIAMQVQTLSGGDLVKAMILTLWISAIASAFIDNIPFVATMMPLLDSLIKQNPQWGGESQILWWALALGACLGGNGTVIGASANVVTAGLAEKAKCPLTFWEFMKVGFPAMIVEVLICMGWLLWIDPLISPLLRHAAPAAVPGAGTP